MRKAEIILEYQPLIHEPPVQPGALYAQAASNDEPTIKFWENIWLGNITANKQTFGSFKDNSVAAVFGKYQYMPIIIAGSGPSLKGNAKELKNRRGIPLVSCLHNFHYFEELELAPEFYVSLDAGQLTIEEVTEGGSRPEEEYWAMTKDRTLVAFIGTHPELLRKWQGRVLFFNAPIPKEALVNKIDAIEDFGVYLSTGGNVLGACLYFAKCILGAGQIIFTGADFSFGYDRQFHPWQSKYDANMGNYVRVTDIYGIKVCTWPSYYGFKAYFDSVPLRLGGIYYNCTEGGCLGAYDSGNLSVFKYMDLKDCIQSFHWNNEIEAQIKDPTTRPRKLIYS